LRGAVRGIRAALVVLLAMASSAGLAYGDEDRAAKELAQGHADAQEFGIFFGGMATQYDLCVKKGFLPSKKQSAEATAKLLLEKIRNATPGPDQSTYVQLGWDLAKQEIASRQKDYTRERCSSFVATEWAKMLATLHAE
jgi:hypothetical protein